MQANGLLSIITFSEKRKNILFLLQESPRTLSEINSYFDVKTPEIQPRLKELETSNLITRQNGRYQLTLFGTILMTYYEPLLNTISAMEGNEEFWNTHDLDSVPVEFLSRIKDLHNCELVKLDNCNLCESHKEFLENVSKSIRFKGATCIFIREWIYLFSELSKEEIPIEIIVTSEIYEKIKKEYSIELETGLKNPNARMYVCDEPFGVSFATSELFTEEKFFSLSLNFRNGLGHDHKQDLIGFDLDAVKWGNDLFKCYKERSVEIMPEQSKYLVCEGECEEVEIV